MPELLSRLQSALSDRYRLDREIGAGGMATVYLAHDIRHDRRVALKVLRPELAAVIGAERFLAEIRLTANLQHSHILPLFDSGEADSYLFYVMPFVQGETLRDRLTREKQLPVADALRIATEVASALDYAHRNGVVHRDIKPENILIHDGQALVADFGIALAASKASGARMTETGMSLGTPHYMSPEQAMGEREITPRSDVYALGAVLYEMLTGDPPFTGSTAQAVVARVVTESPRPLVPQRHTIPPHVEAAVLTALEKLPADRFASAAQFAEALGNRSYASTTVTAAVTLGARARARRGARAYVVGGTLVLAIAAAVWGWLRPGPAPVVNRYSLFLRPSEALQASVNGSINVAISPDGKRVAYVGPGDGGGRIWLREHDKLRPVPINGTEGGTSPFFSPDGRSLGFLVGGRTVRVISLGGGPAITLSDSVNSSGGDWGSDGYVYVEVDSGIARIRATGGAQEPVYRLGQQKKEIGTEFPNVLPGGKGMIFRLRHAGQAPADYDIMAMKLPGGEAHALMHGLYARYASPGQLLVVTGDGKLLAVPFDPDKLAFTGPAVAMLEGMRTGGFESNLATSAEGTLVYVSGGSAGQERAFWVGRDGAATPVDSAWDPQGVLNTVSLSPDGKTLAVGLVRGAAEDIWVKQLPTGTFSRVTFGDSIHNRVSWAADGRSVLYLVGSQNSGVPAVTRADGTGTPRVLYGGRMGFGQTLFSRDGRWLLLRRVVSEAGNGDIYALKTGDSALTALLATPAREVSPALSPDGRWLAYGSNESGRAEVYVRPFPDVGSAKWQVSLSGGFTPMWAHSGKELFYLNGNQELVAVTVQPGATFSVGGQKVLFPAATYSFAGTYPTYDVAPDDRRFVMIRSVAPSTDTELVLIQNWAEELKTRAP
jgi:eukaryotic-like serine/threonine-protein kinase